MIRTRTQTINRLHVLLTKLIPGGAPTNLSADAAAGLLRTVRSRDIAAAVEHTGTTLTSLYGIGIELAGKTLARVGDIHRFRSPAAFASYTGTAPIEVSSGDVVRHRLSRAGDRQLNHVLHMMALTQIRHNTEGRAYYQRKRAAGKGHKEAMRCLKRRLSDTVYRQLLRDAQQTQAAGPGGHSGAALSSSAAD